ncbi:TPA: hypothetical protein ACH3X2_002632 [Trebouxia sp. C0005]
MSTTILDKGAKDAKEQLEKLVEASDGKSCSLFCYSLPLQQFAAEADEVFRQFAKYMAKSGPFAGCIPRFQEVKYSPAALWGLMSQAAPQLAKLGIYLSQVVVNSAAVERLFSAFGNIQTKRRSKLLHERVMKLALVKTLLGRKPRSASKAAGSQYLGSHSHSTRSSHLRDEAARLEQQQAISKTDQEYLNGPEDLLISTDQVQEVVQEYEAAAADAEDDDDDEMYQQVSSNVNKCSIFNLFKDLPPFDLNLLFDSDLEVCLGEAETNTV